MGDIRLILGDCLEVLPTLAPGSIDAVVTDPPYGTRVERDGYGRRPIWSGSQHVAGDDSIDTMRLGMTEAFRCLKVNSWAAVCCSPKCHRQSIEACEAAGFRNIGEFVWDKMAPGLGGGIRYQHETILLMAKGNPSGHDQISSVLRFAARKVATKPDHPSQKPVSLYAALIRYCSTTGDTILDPFMGTGRSGVAAIRLEREFVGCELDPAYFAIAKSRIEAEQTQYPLLESARPVQADFLGETQS